MTHPSTTLFLFALTIYSMSSKYLFDQVFNTSQEIIDEVFHFDQGMEYCNWNFTYWNPKITTPPGLYVISTIFCNSIVDCHLYSMRFINLVASAFNMYMITRILTHYQGVKDCKTIFQAFNISLLPPIYFFAFFYYTDVISITFFLLLCDFSIRNFSPAYLILASTAAIFLRQTNVIWVGMFLGVRLMEIFLKVPNYKKLRSTTRVYKDRTRMAMPKFARLNNQLPTVYTALDFLKSCKYHVATKLRFLSECIMYNFGDFFPYFFVMLAFVSFLVLNGSITFGDKDAHMASLHLPQLFYFSLFYGVFGLPFLLNTLVETLSLIYKYKIAAIVVIFLFILIVEFNTIIHPYLLADNRHYTFYIWNRWFGRYWFAGYVTTPIYLFLLTSIVVNFKNVCVSYWLPLLPCMFAAVALQKMIEIRYFFIPYLMLRFKFERPPWIVVLTEFILYMVINYIAFKIFFTKEIYWRNMKDAQRLIW